MLIFTIFWKIILKHRVRNKIGWILFLCKSLQYFVFFCKILPFHCIESLFTASGCLENVKILQTTKRIYFSFFFKEIFLFIFSLKINIFSTRQNMKSAGSVDPKLIFIADFPAHNIYTFSLEKNTQIGMGVGVLELYLLLTD